MSTREEVPATALAARYVNIVRKGGDITIGSVLNALADRHDAQLIVGAP